MRSTVLAACAVAAAVAVWRPSGAGLLRRRGLATRAHWTRRRRVFVGGATLLAVVLVVGRDGRWWLGTLAAVVATILSGRLWHGQQLRQRADRRRRQVLEVCESLAAELQAGLAPIVALEHSVDAMPELSPALTAARIGGDVPLMLRELARLPGAEALRSLAAGWQIAQRTGGTLAAVLERVVEGIRDDESARREVAAALGPPRATARLLAVLPLGGIGLGTSIGASPVHILLGTTLGLGCLGVGVSLALLGVLWVERLANAVR